MGRFKKGLFLGGLLGASAVWLNTTAKGRETKEKMTDAAADIYTDLKDSVLASKQWDKMTKQKYVKMVNKAVDQYIKKYPALERVGSMIKKLVISQWKRLEREIAAKKK